MAVEIKAGSTLTDEARQRAIHNLEVWHEPLNPVSIVDLISEMRLKTSSKKYSQEDLITQAKIYARDLMEYPASVVDHVLKTQPNVDRWWPDWNPLLLRIESYCRKNKLTLKALREYEPTAKEAKKERVSPDAVDKIMQDLREKMAKDAV